MERVYRNKTGEERGIEAKTIDRSAYDPSLNPAVKAGQRELSTLL
jgi:hypothetical protein